MLPSAGELLFSFRSVFVHDGLIHAPLWCPHDYYEEEGIVGYDVKYRCNGRIYRTRVDRESGTRAGTGDGCSRPGSQFNNGG